MISVNLLPIPRSEMNPSSTLKKSHSSFATTSMTRPNYSFWFKSTSNSSDDRFEKMLRESLNFHVEHMDPLTDPSEIEVKELQIRDIKQFSKEQVEVLTDTSLGYFSKSQTKALQERVEIFIRENVKEHGIAQKKILDISQKINSLDSLTVNKVKKLKFFEASALMNRLKSHRDSGANASLSKTLTRVLAKLEEICKKHKSSIDKNLDKKKELMTGRTLKNGALPSLYAKGVPVVISQALKKRKTTAGKASEMKVPSVHLDNFGFKIANVHPGTEEKFSNCIFGLDESEWV